MKILIIEDEELLAASIIVYLKNENFAWEWVDNFHNALDRIILHEYDCIILDINIPGGSGLNLLSELKGRKKQDGVLIISARNSLDDRINGLGLGADDYLAKPFHMAELGARLHAIIRRRKFEGQNTIQIQDILINIKSKNVYVNGAKVNLTKSEFDLLVFLISNKNRVISKIAIAEHLSGDNVDIFDNFDFIYSHVKNLKKKLTEAGTPDYIETVYGLGYKFAT